MELIHNRDSKIKFTNGTETFEFFNLADYSYDVGDTKNFWMLRKYTKKIIKYEGDPGNLRLDVSVAFNPNGTYAWIQSGYFTNDIIRRELELDSEGRIKRDRILVFDPQCPSNIVSYSSPEAKGLPLNEYLGESQRHRVYRCSYRDGAFINNILGDTTIEDFLLANEEFRQIFNAFGSDSKKVAESIARIRDSLDIDMLNWEAKEAMKARNQEPPKVYYKMKETSEED